MNRRNRIFIGILVAYLAGVGLLMWRLLNDIDPRYRESAEESLVETAHLLASLIEPTSSAVGPDTTLLGPLFQSLYAREVQADIFGFRKTRIELRALVVDVRGIVLYDSTQKNFGQDFSHWRDVRLALAGEYGARTTPEIDDDTRTSVMHVAAPILVDGTVVGAVSVGKPVTSFGQFVDAARRKTLTAGLFAATSALVLAVILSLWVVTPNGMLTAYTRQLRSQGRFSVGLLLRHTWETMRLAFRDMRDALAGRSYAADYVQTLTHELKSPLSAIRGAAELLQEPMSDEDRRHFVLNIERETRRIQELVDRMMELAALESRRELEDPVSVAMLPLLTEAAASAQIAGAPRGIRVQLDAREDAQVLGDALLLRRAVGNLLANALEFTPDGSQIVLALTHSPQQVRVEVRDAGPGVPHYAGEKVFEKFYSLARPGGTRRSTGLGLPFVREIAHLHHGRASLRNHPDGGALATLELPPLRGGAS